jgi:hypothetical protein
MNFKSDCPSWLCNEWGVPHDIYYFLAFLLLIAPYALIWRRLFKGSQTLISTPLGCGGLILLTQITLLIYLTILIALASSFDGHFVLAVCYGPIIIISALLVPTIIITIFLAIFSARKKETGSKTNIHDDDLNT